MSCCIFVSRSVREEEGGGGEEIDGGVGVRRCRSWRELGITNGELLLYWQSGVFWIQSVCVGVCQCCIIVLFSPSVRFLPLADHMPQSVSGALPPQAEAMLVQQQIAQYAAVWAQMHTLIYASWQAGEACIHTHTHNNMLPFWISLEQPNMFFPSVSSSFFSHGFHFLTL